MKLLHSLLIATGMLALVPLSAHGSVSLLDGLAFYLDFEGATPMNTAGTSVTMTNNGTGGVTSNSLTGHFAPIESLAGKAGYFNRSESDWIGINTSLGSGTAAAGGTSLGYSFTISAWYYTEIGGVHSGDKRLFVYESKGDYDLSYAIRGDSTPVNGSYTGTVYTSANNPISYNVSNAGYFDSTNNLGAWNQVVETFTLTDTTITKQMYLNGELAGTTTMPQASLSSAGINLGTYRGADGRYWDGFLDEVGLWNRALSSDEIAALYELNYIEGRSVTSLAPEPSRAALMMAAFAALSLRRNRRRPCFTSTPVRHDSISSRPALAKALPSLHSD